MRNNPKSNNKKTKIAIVIVAILIVLGGGFIAFKLLHKDPYTAYTAYNEDSKKAGTMEHETKEEDLFYLSFYYPTFDIKELDEAITTYIKEVQTDLKQNSKIIISVDYDSEELYDAYISVTMHEKLMDENGKQLSLKSTSFNYDKNLKKMMSVDDVLRRDYLSLLKTKAKEEKLDEKAIARTKLTNFILKNDGVTFYFDQDTTRGITINYADNKPYIALTNENIPSLYQKAPIIPAKEENIDPNKPMIAFTFDDGPSDLTTKLMDAFDKYDAKATFFMVGPNAEARPEVIADMYQRGFELGNHTWTHGPELTTLTKKQLYDEIYNTQDAIFKAAGKDAAFLRAPYGAYNEDVLKASTMAHAFWSIDTEDWSSRNTDAVKKEIMKNLSDGSIILEHDLYPTSVEAAIELLPELKQQGYQFVTLSTLMKYKGDMLTSNHFITPSLY